MTVVNTTVLPCEPPHNAEPIFQSYIQSHVRFCNLRQNSYYSLQPNSIIIYSTDLHFIPQMTADAENLANFQNYTISFIPSVHDYELLMVHTLKTLLRIIIFTYCGAIFSLMLLCT